MKLAKALPKAVRVRLQERKAEVFNVMDEAMKRETDRIRRRLSYIHMTSIIAPLLGVLGTALGLVEAFQKLSRSRTVPLPDTLSEDIAKALITTWMALLVAIAARLLLHFLRIHGERRVLAISALAKRLISSACAPMS